MPLGSVRAYHRVADPDQMPDSAYYLSGSGESPLGTEKEEVERSEVNVFDCKIMLALMSGSTASGMPLLYW